MASYKIDFKPSVEKDLRSIAKRNLQRIMNRLQELCENPRPRDSLKLSGSEGLFRIRVGDYRVIYEIDTQKDVITVHHIRHRRDAYRNI